MRQIIVGTVDQMLTRSRSISSRASSGVNLPGTITSRRPPSSPTTSVEWHPDTWNSGEVNSAAVWPPVDSAAGSPRRSSTVALAVSRNTVFCRLATMPRWVEMAPLGRPVVPEV